MAKRLKDMTDDDLATVWARLANDMADVQKELSRRGLWRNFQDTQARLRATVEREARADASGGPKSTETANDASFGPSTKTASS